MIIDNKVRIIFTLIWTIFWIFYYMIWESASISQNTQKIKENLQANKEIVKEIRDNWNTVRLWKEQSNLSSYILNNKEIEKIVNENKRKAEELESQYIENVTKLELEYQIQKEVVEKEVNDLKWKTMLSTVELFEVNAKIKDWLETIKKLSEDANKLKFERLKNLVKSNTSDTIAIDVNDLKKQFLVIRDKQWWYANLNYMKDSYALNDWNIQAFSPLCDSFSYIESTKTLKCWVWTITNTKKNYFSWMRFY